MKTPEEIKRGLKLCSHEGHGEEIICEHCPYDSNSCAVLICTRRLSADALAYIQQLETENHQLLTKAQQLESTISAVGINYQCSWNQLSVQLESTISQVSKALCGKENATLKELLQAADQLKARAPRWISVEERLPGTEDPVLILVKETEHYGLHKEKSKVYYCQYLAYWDDDEWYTSWCNGCRKISDTAKEPNADEYEVTHWMPLPEPPEEDEK